MAQEDDLRKCLEDIEGVKADANRLRTRWAEGAKEDLSRVEPKIDKFKRDAREWSEKLASGIREGWDEFVAAWRGSSDKMRANLRLIEVKNILVSARRLAAEQYFVAAEAELTAALRIVLEARAVLPPDDPKIVELVRDIDRAVAEIRLNGQVAAFQLEKVAASNEKLLAAIAG